MYLNKFKPAFAALSVILIAAMPAFALPQESKWHVPDSAMAVVVLRPQDALMQPGMELVPREIISVFGNRELGFDPCEVVTATGIVETVRDLNGGPPGFALVLNFNSPQKPGERILEHLEPGEFRGMTIYRGPSPMEPSILQLDGQTIILGNEPFIAQMMAPATGKGAVTSLMSNQPLSGHVAVWLAIEPVRDLIRQNLPPAGQIPPPFRDFLRLPDLIDNVTANLDLSGGGIHRLQIGAVDARAAGETVEILKTGMVMARSMIMAQMMQEMQNEDPDLQQAFEQYAQRIGDFAEASLAPKVDGPNLVFQSESGNPAMNMATIGVLTGLLLPAVQQVREAARRTQSMNNLKQLALAMHNYESTHGKFPGQANLSPDGKPLLSWRVHMLPYLDEQNLYEQFHLNEPWDSAHNLELLDHMPPTFQNPNFPSRHETVYLAFSGPKTPFADGRAPAMRDIRDGLSNTIMFVEADPDHAVEWTRPADLSFDPDDPALGLGGLRPGGFNAVFWDGSVQFIKNLIDPEILSQLINPADGTVISDIDW